MAAYHQIDHNDDQHFYLNPQSAYLRHDSHFDSLSPLKAPSTSAYSFYDSTEIIESEICPPNIADDSLMLRVQKRHKVLYWLQVCVTILVITLVALCWVYSSYWYEWTESYFQLLRQQRAWFAPICWMGTCYIGIQLLIPQTLLTLCGGFIFTKIQGLKGIITSIGVVWCGCSLGATQSFINCRYLYQRCECSKRALTEYPDYDRISNALLDPQLAESLIVTMRLIPWTPYNVLNLSMATTTVPLSHFVLGHVGMVPDIIMNCFFGAFLDSLARVLNHDSGPDNVVEMLAETLIWSLVSIFIIIYIGKVAFDKYETTLNEAVRNMHTRAILTRLETRKSQMSFMSSRTIVDEELESNVSLM